MKLARLPLLLLYIGTAHAAASNDPSAESCDQIRTQIKAHAGVSDKPLPQDDQPSRGVKQREHDDD
jgi:hypothetical protein